MRFVVIYHNSGRIILNIVQLLVQDAPAENFISKNSKDIRPKFFLDHRQKFYIYQVSSRLLKNTTYATRVPSNMEKRKTC